MNYEAPDALVVYANGVFESGDTWGDRWEVELDPVGEG